MYREWRSTNDITEFTRKKINFKTFDKIVDQSIENAKRKYYYDTFMSQKDDIKKTWSTINDALNRNTKRIDYPKEFILDNQSFVDSYSIANHFNSFFTNIGINLSARIELNDNSSNFTDYLIEPRLNQFSLNQITESDVHTIIHNLKNKKSSGNDDISNILLKSIKNEISKPLSVIINQTLLTGIYPDALKIAKVIPLKKRK